MRIGATADLHYFAPKFGVIQEQLAQVRDQADLLVVAGDLTNYGKPPEMEQLLNSLFACPSWLFWGITTTRVGCNPN